MALPKTNAVRLQQIDDGMNLLVLGQQRSSSAYASRHNLAKPFPFDQNEEPSIHKGVANVVFVVL